MPSLADEWRVVLAQMPETVRAAIPTVLWQRDALWALALPVEEVAVAELAWMLDLPMWSVDGRPFQVTPNLVRTQPERYPEQYRRTLACDLAYPVHLIWHNGRWTILDGLHRLLKADMLGWATIRAMKLSAADFRRIIAPDNEW